MAKQIGSVPQAALARAQIAPATLAFVEGAPAAAERITRERITGGEHVARCRQSLGRRRRTRRRRTRGRTIVGVIHSQATPAEVVTVEASDRIRGLRVASVLDERESA